MIDPRALLATSILLAALTSAAAEVRPPGAPVVASPDRSPRALALLTFRLLARQEAEQAHVPFDLVDSVMKIESNFDPARIGGVGEIGLMQVRPTTAAMLGFRGDDATLATPAVNIHYGTAYLAGAWRSAKGNVCRALMKYRAGQGEEGMSPLSVQYCTRARDYLTSVSSPLAAEITPADLIATIRGATVSAATTVDVALDAGVPSIGHVKSGPKFWANFKARIGRINARIEARWRNVASR